MKSIDIAALLNDETLTIPIHGTPYTIAPISGAQGLLLQMIMDVSSGDSSAEKYKDQLTGLDGGDVYRLALGDALDTMQADELPLAAIRLSTAIATRWHLYGAEAAQAMLDELVKNSRPAPKDRMPTAKTRGKTTSPSMASAPRTRTASTRTTASRATSKKN